jgi:hypothetical protein
MVFGEFLMSDARGLRTVIVGTTLDPGLRRDDASKAAGSKIGIALQKLWTQKSG